jgi:GNAT superfamily N-acetyltransferase
MIARRAGKIGHDLTVAGRRSMRQARGVEIRRLESGDFELLARAVETFTGVRAPAPDLFLEQPRTHAFVALDGEDVIGWCYGYELLRPEGRWMMFLKQIEVLEQRRREGVGRELLEAFVALARSKGHRRMWLYTDAGDRAARGLYEGAGGAPGDAKVGYWWAFE